MRNKNKGVFLNGFFYYGGEMQINIQNQGDLNFQNSRIFLYFSIVEIITSSGGAQIHVDI